MSWYYFYTPPKDWELHFSSFLECWQRKFNLNSSQVPLWDLLSAEQSCVVQGDTPSPGQPACHIWWNTRLLYTNYKALLIFSHKHRTNFKTDNNKEQNNYWHGGGRIHIRYASQTWIQLYSWRGYKHTHFGNSVYRKTDVLIIIVKQISCL